MQTEKEEKKNLLIEVISFVCAFANGTTTGGSMVVRCANPTRLIYLGRCGSVQLSSFVIRRFSAPFKIVCVCFFFY